MSSSNSDYIFYIWAFTLKKYFSSSKKFPIFLRNNANFENVSIYSCHHVSSLWHYYNLFIYSKTRVRWSMHYFIKSLLLEKPSIWFIKATVVSLSIYICRRLYSLRTWENLSGFIFALLFSIFRISFLDSSWASFSQENYRRPLGSSYYILFI